MGYWGEVFCQAGREALEKVRWSNPVRVAVAVGPTLASGAVTWAVTGAPAYGALASVATLALLALAFFVEGVAKVPPALAAEASKAYAASEAIGKAARLNLERSLASYAKPEADASLMDGVGYVLGGVWGRAVEARSEGLEQVGAVISDIEARAHNDGVTVWGRDPPTARPAKVDPAYWTLEGIDLESVFRGDDAEVKTTKRAPKADRRYWDLMVNRAEFEREWRRPT